MQIRTENRTSAVATKHKTASMISTDRGIAGPIQNIDIAANNTEPATFPRNTRYRSGMLTNRRKLAVESDPIENRQLYQNRNQQRLLQDGDYAGRDGKVESEQECRSHRQPDNRQVASPLQPDIDIPMVLHKSLS